MSDRIVLYDNAFSPYAFKVRATLYEKEIDHEKSEVRHAADRAKLLEVSPRGEVPALCHGEVRLYDSSVICEYLETVFPKIPLLPSSAAGQARCRTLERLSDGAVDAAVIVLAMRMFSPRALSAEPALEARAAEQVERLYTHLERELGEQEYLCGSFSRADLALAPHIAGAAFLGKPPQGRLQAWFERVSARPAIQRATGEFMAAYQASQEDAEPFFSREHLHMRDHRLEWCVRLGLGPWLVEELAAGRVVFSPVP